LTADPFEAKIAALGGGVVRSASGEFLMKIQLFGSFTLAIIMLGLVREAPAQTHKLSVLYNFGSNGGDPEDPEPPGIISQGRDGNLYSTTYSGGSTQDGTVFKITPTGKMTILYDFDNTQGVDPTSGLTLATNGKLYGAASLGGASSYGTLFKTTPGGTLTTLYNFTGGNDGGFPSGPPIQSTDGNLYGTVGGGGKFGCGTVYKVAHAEKVITLHQFDGKNGCSPASPLSLGSDGNFYGITRTGGNADYGLIFKVTPTGRFTVIYRLGRRTGPAYALILANDGDFYGATTSGGQGYGTVFKITPAGKLTILHNFTEIEGYAPPTGLMEATDGNFYGTRGGGADNYGSIFKITPRGHFKVLYYFDDTTGAFPLGNLIQRTNGILYGETNLGGTAGYGVFYKLDIGLKPFVSFVSAAGNVGEIIEILGQGFVGTKAVSFNGTAATFKVISDTYLTAIVPKGATTGFVTVATTKGKLKSNKKFRVL
jgi:uncharacterized repeat protein (TIGR03803 family)